MIATKVDKCLGLRERNKLEKRMRIYQAARRLFEKQGYDLTTMREIARAADVGEGTVFLYARDKSELLFRIFKDDLTAVVDDAFKRLSRDAPILDRLVTLLTPMLTLFQPNATLARIMVRENFNLTGPPATAAADLHDSINSKLGRLLLDAQERKEIRTDCEIAVLVECVWVNYRFYVDDWLGQRNSAVPEGAARIRAGLSLLFEGIGDEGTVRIPSGRRAYKGSRR
jgi:AcrR family transcriptional regulator